MSPIAVMASGTAGRLLVFPELFPPGLTPLARSFTGHAAFLLPFSSLVILQLPPISPESLSLADAGLNYWILISSSNFYPELQTPKSSCLQALSA